MIKGVDVSKWQGNINWDNALKHVDFVIIRAGAGSTIDPKADYNAKCCNNLGIPIGFYWFSYALTPAEAIKEADQLCDFAMQYKVSYPLYYDSEYDTDRYRASHGVTNTKILTINCTEAFCKKVEERGGFAGYYTNLDYYNNVYKGSLIDGRYTMWYARYNTAVQPLAQAALWQFSDKTMIPGIGKCDVNYDLSIPVDQISRLNQIHG